MQENIAKKKHTLFLENRESLELSGINDVGAFNEEEISAESDWGSILIKGSGLKIEVLDLDTGSLKIKGNIQLFVYNDKTSGKGILGRMFS